MARDNFQNLMDVASKAIFGEPGSKFFHYYKIATFLVMKWIATLVVALSALGLILIISDWIFEIGWEYPWWSPLISVAGIASALVVRKLVAEVLRKMVRPTQNAPEGSRS
jgi:hypothetical protein